MVSPPAPSRAERILSAGRPPTRRGNWWALGVGTVFGATGILIYGAATSENGPGGLVGVAFLLALAAYSGIAFISGREEWWKRAGQAALVMVLLGLPLGLLSRVIGAAVGFGIGVVITLNPPRFSNLFRNRLLGVLLAVTYAFLLVLVLPPAGVMAAAFLPPLIVGFADEFTAWRSQNSP